MPLRPTRPQPLSLFLTAALAGIGTASGCHRAEPQERLTLEAKLPATFGQLSNVTELGNGRVMFADTRDKLLLSADLASGDVDTIGTRVDTMPLTAPDSVYRFPGWVAHLRGDTVALVDFSAIRTTLWSEGGRALGVLPIAPVAGLTPVLVYDTVGHGYKIDYQTVLGGGEPGRTVLPDSIPVLRIALASGTADTVAYLTAPEYGNAIFGTQTQTVAKVFGPNDFFGVLPDGTAWVARGRENRVDWRSPSGTWTRGEARTYTPVPVSQEDRERVMTQVREQGRQHGLPEGLAINYPFAEQKPPFDYALGRVEGGNGGEVWLQRSRARQDEAATYDVFDRQGRWQRSIVLPQGALLAGFGKDGAIYLSVKEGEKRTVGRSRIH